MRALTCIVAATFYVAVLCQQLHGEVWFGGHGVEGVGCVLQRQVDVLDKKHVLRGISRNISANIPQKWLVQLLQDVQQEPQTLHPVLVEFQQLIETNTRIYMLFQSMFQEMGDCPYEVQSYQQLLQVLNHIITCGPAWSEDLVQADRAGLSILAVIGRVKSTVSGVAAFLDPQVNAMVGKVLNAWGAFLRSPASAVVLNNSSGWFSASALQHLTDSANAGISNYSFGEMFVSDPAAPYYGFRSWDDFFARSFREGIRPVASADDNNVITNACEHTPTNVVHGVKLRDQFWIKGRHYSILDMLGHGNRAMADHFVGGTVYQGLLSALSYHRWHAPVSGRIVQAYVLDGMHYAPLVYSDGRLEELAESEYGPAMSTRVVFLIEADNPAVGLVAFIAVGLAEVSTCEMTASEGEYVRKGDQLGMFHYGGSTHCLLFRAGVNLTGFPDMESKKSVPADTIRRSKLHAVTITTKTPSDISNIATPRTTSIIRSDISHSTLSHVSARHSVITNSVLSHVASARHLDAKDSRFEDVLSVRRSTITVSTVTGRSSITRSRVHGSVVADGSSVRRSSLDNVQMASSRVKRSTLRDCDVRNCIIQRTDFKGVVLRNEVWKNGRLVGRIGPSEQSETADGSKGEKVITKEAKVWMQDESESDVSDDESVQSKSDAPPPYSE
ncbi:hypothetical protein HFD88_005062 [Aspergillus terreus]|nr:hypothetical protein HFD88_005062 [Aspergillus terreus]